jgi:hypothetical protein
LGVFIAFGDESRAIIRVRWTCAGHGTRFHG